MVANINESKIHLITSEANMKKWANANECHAADIGSQQHSEPVYESPAEGQESAVDVKPGGTMLNGVQLGARKCSEAVQSPTMVISWVISTSKPSSSMHVGSYCSVILLKPTTLDSIK